MKSVRLLSLTLKDFQGGTFTLEADGNNVNVFAANGKGKTRLASAFSWLLFDKDSLGRSDFSIKNLDATGEAEHGLEHAVEGVFEVNGAPVTLTKIFKEIWTKKRGSAEATFSGHTTDHFINGVPVQKKEYVAKVAEIAGDEATFRLLTSPTVFASLPWQKQRGILLEVCGNISDAEVIESDPKLSALLTILGKNTLDDHKKIVAGKLKKINEELEKIPVRIDEVRRGMPDVLGIHQQATEQNIADLETALAAANLKLQGIDTGGEMAELSKKLVTVYSQIKEAREKHSADIQATVSRLNAGVSDIEATLRSERRRDAEITAELDRKNRRIAAIDALLNTLRDKWVGIDERTFAADVVDTCAACGQSLPVERVEEAKAKALAAFNLKNAEDLKKNETEGRALADERMALAASLEELMAEAHKVRAEIAEHETALGLALINRDTVKATAEDYSLIPGHDDLILQRTTVEADIAKAKEGVSVDADKVRAEIADLAEKLKVQKEHADRFVRRESGEKRIEELKKDEKRLASEYEAMQAELFLCESFIKAKVNLLTERINDKFEFTNFKLFNDLINGGIEECCTLTVNGIPYDSGLNNAARIQAGCDIVRTLQRHYGIQAPMWLDNREGCTRIPDMSCQTISLYVSPEDEVLRVEFSSASMELQHA